jgi:uracil phosphoribosyltransferase
MVFNLTHHNSVASQFLFELRDVNIQKDRARFRRNVERLGQILAYEISKSLSYKNITSQTPLTTADFSVPAEFPVLITILRAGLPLLEGFLQVFDQSDSGFIGAFRQEGSEMLTIKMEYAATPSIKNREVILLDPMLATGKSAVRAIEHLLSRETPERVHVASVISSPEGLKHVQEFAKTISCPVLIWTCSIDKGLNDKFYIVPGLGDAGDLSFGNK